MCDDMDGLMSKSADTTCTKTSTCTMPGTLLMCIMRKRVHDRVGAALNSQQQISTQHDTHVIIIMAQRVHNTF